MKVRIKTGVLIGHDHEAFRWPYCKPPAGDRLLKPDAVFDGVFNKSNDTWVCRREGYGAKSFYGNGAIHVIGENNVTTVEEKYTAEELLIKHGICIDCGEISKHAIDEPSASCACHTISPSAIGAVSSRTK